MNKVVLDTTESAIHLPSSASNKVPFSRPKMILNESPGMQFWKTWYLGAQPLWENSGTNFDTLILQNV